MRREAGALPVPAGVLFGLGLGGFFDGTALHQVPQWRHLLTSAGFPADSVTNLRINTLADGLFHASTCAFVVAASSCCGGARGGRTCAGRASC